MVIKVLKMVCQHLLSENIDTTSWGVVPTNFSIVDAFDNEPSSRQYQDVGLTD